jgi:hypothetical protein
MPNKPFSISQVSSLFLISISLWLTSCTKPPSVIAFGKNGKIENSVVPGNRPNGGGGGGGSGGSGNVEPDPVKRIASNEKEPLKRVNRGEYANIMIGLFGGFVDSQMIESMATAELPGDVPGEIFDNSDQSISKSHVLAFNSIAEKLAVSLVDNSKFSSAIACASFNKSCVDGFLSMQASRILRRPLTEEEKTAYAKLFNDAGGDKVGFATMLSAFLQSPQFVYKIEVGDDKGNLNPYELASRLSFALTNSAPDDRLWSAAQKGLSGSDVESETARLFEANGSKAVLKSFLLQWLGQKKSPPPGYSKAYLEGMDINGLGADALKEIEDLLEYYVWKTPGTISDIFTTKKAFHKQGPLKAIYDKDSGGQGDELAAYRAGIQGRASFLMTGTDASHLVHRGILVRRNFLCDKIIFPTITEENKEAFSPPKPDPKASTRKQIEARTAEPTCQVCHARINPPGFAFEAFDGVGRVRKEEKIFDADNGSLLARLPIDTTVEGSIDPDKVAKITGPETIASLLGESTLARKCFVKRWYQYVSRRELTDNDQCYLDQMEESLNAGKSIKSLMLETLNQGGFRRVKACE